jgi:hypothetical protein
MKREQLLRETINAAFIYLWKDRAANCSLREPFRLSIEKLRAATQFDGFDIDELTQVALSELGETYPVTEDNVVTYSDGIVLKYFTALFQMLQSPDIQPEDIFDVLDAYCISIDSYFQNLNS